jgi:hypothetical protein
VTLHDLGFGGSRLTPGLSGRRLTGVATPRDT